MKPDYLYDLLPAIYRERDGDEESQLQAFMAALQIQAQLLESDIDALYDDWFIETCAEWAIPLIGELVDAGRYFPPLAETARARALVANTARLVATRGTPATLASVIAYTTGWGISLVDFEQQLAGTQSLRFPQTSLRRTADLRADTVSSFRPDIRPLHPSHAGAKPGRYGLRKAGIVTNRVLAYPIENSIPHALAADSEHRHGTCYTFDSLGCDTLLYEAPVRVDAGPTPHTLQRLTQALASAVPLPFSITGVEPNQLFAGTLASWHGARQDVITVDPELGRFFLPDGLAAISPDLRVSYRYGATADLGAGPYPRALEPQSVTLEALQKPCQSGSILYAASPGETPTLTGDLHFTGVAPGLTISIDGLRLAGSIHLAGNVQLTLSSCTLCPEAGAPAILGAGDIASSIEVKVQASIVAGTIALSALNASLAVNGSIVDGRVHPAIRGVQQDPQDDPGPTFSATASTFFGPVVISLAEQVTDTLFTAPLRVLDRFHSQIDSSWEPNHDTTAVPQFYSRRLGDPLYARLRPGSGPAILQGADDGGELGVFHGSSWLGRERLLERVATEWTPLGLEIALLERVS